MFRVMSVMTTSIPLQNLLIYYNTVRKKNQVDFKKNNITKSNTNMQRFYKWFIDNVPSMSYNKMDRR